MTLTQRVCRSLHDTRRRFGSTIGAMQPPPQNPAHPVETTGAHALLSALRSSGIDTVYVGGRGEGTCIVADALGTAAGLRLVRLASAQSAAHAAEGHMRTSGRLAALLVASGADLHAAIAGLASAHADSIGLLALCVHDDATDEAQVLGQSQAVTKWSGRAEHAAEIGALVRRGIGIARNARMGPVLLELPHDVLRQPDDGRSPRACRISRRQDFVGGSAAQAPQRQLERVVKLIAESRRPLVYAGGGVVRSGAEACAALAELLRAAQLPCALTLTGLAALPARHPHRLGLLGPWGSAAANAAMRQADLVIAFGARFDAHSFPREGADAGDRRVIHVDIDPVNIHRVVRADVPVVGDCGEVLSRLAAMLSADPPDPARLDGWWSQLAEIRSVSELVAEASGGAITPPVLMQALRQHLAGGEAVVTLDLGRHTSWMPAHLGFEHAGQWVCSAGAAPAGHGLAAAVGAAVARPRTPVVCITDAVSLLAAAQELPRIAAAGWPIKLLCIGGDAGEPDAQAIAQACGWSVKRVEQGARLPEALRRCVASDGPQMLLVGMDASSLMPRPSAGGRARPAHRIAAQMLT